MKHLSGLWHKLTVVVAVAAALSSCNRAEYAMLPKTTSYHGTERVAPQPQSAPPVKEITYDKAVAISGKEDPAATPAQAVAAAPIADEPVVPKAVAAAPQAATPAAVAPFKLPLVPNAVIEKATRKADKIVNKIMLKKSRETAGAKEANAITGNLRTGIILLLVGLLISLIPGSIFDLVGGIVSIIGIIFIVLWLLDNL